MNISDRNQQNTEVENLARQSLGYPIYRMVARILTQRNLSKGLFVDVGCGRGNLRSFVWDHCEKYIGVDAVKYSELPEDIEIIICDLNTGKIPLPEGFADVVCSVETIEHLENPRAFMRELVRLTKPGGLLIVTTPNQLSLLSKLTLILKNQFNGFQEAPGLYPAHITALLPIDLYRITTECQLTDIRIVYSNFGRIPFTPWSYPQHLGLRGQLFSDNVIISGIKPKTFYKN